MNKKQLVKVLTRESNSRLQKGKLVAISSSSRTFRFAFDFLPMSLSSYFEDTPYPRVSPLEVSKAQSNDK